MARSRRSQRDADAREGRPVTSGTQTVGPQVRLDDFLADQGRAERAALRGYFARVRESADPRTDDPDRARTEAEWRALLDAELTRPIA